jgi:hypothetical protein
LAKDRPFFTLRAFAAANFIVAALGLFFLLGSVYAGARAGALRNTPENPYFVPSFWTMTAINVCFLGLLVVGGFYLFKPRMLGVAVCNAVFISEILYFLSLSLWGLALPKNISMSIAAATGVGNMGLGPQLISGYPLFALGGLNLARRAAVHGFLKSKDRNVQSS